MSNMGIYHVYEPSLPDPGVGGGGVFVYYMYIYNTLNLYHVTVTCFINIFVCCALLSKPHFHNVTLYDCVGYIIIKLCV